MKLIVIFTLLLSLNASAEAPCDIRLGQTVGIRSVEFVTENVVHSKILLKEMSVRSLKEEMQNLQDEAICEEKTPRKKCILKFEKRKKGPHLTLFRGADRWLSWKLAGKSSAQKFVRILQQAGFCN